MKIIYNGKETEVSENISLGEFVSTMEFNIARIAIEKNGNIIPKSKYNETILSPNDKLEIVTFVGGG